MPSLTLRRNPARLVVQSDNGAVLREYHLRAMPIDRCRRLAERFLRSLNQPMASRPYGTPYERTK